MYAFNRYFPCKRGLGSNGTGNALKPFTSDNQYHFPTLQPQYGNAAYLPRY